MFFNSHLATNAQPGKNFRKIRLNAQSDTLVECCSHQFKKHKRLGENASKSDLCIRKTSKKFYHKIFGVHWILKSHFYLQNTLKYYGKKLFGRFPYAKVAF
jgi:hypothetical protein